MGDSTHEQVQTLVKNFGIFWGLFRAKLKFLGVILEQN
jgi:hypothetical protein